MLCESVRSEVRVGAHLVVVVHTEGNDVFVRSQKAIACDWANSLGRFPPQHRLDLLRDDRSAEHSGKGIADGELEFALDTLDESPLAAHVQAPASVLSVWCCTADVAPACRISRVVSSMLSGKRSAAS